MWFGIGKWYLLPEYYPYYFIIMFVLASIVTLPIQSKVKNVYQKVKNKKV